MTTNDNITKLLTEIAQLKDTLKEQFAASVEAAAKLSNANLNLATKRIQVDHDIRSKAELLGETELSEQAIANQVVLATLKDKQEIIELAAECQKAKDQIELTRLAIELKLKQLDMETLSGKIPE